MAADSAIEAIKVLCNAVEALAKAVGTENPRERQRRLQEAERAARDARNAAGRKG
jgi:hypothetical protein